MTQTGWGGADPVQVADAAAYEMGTEYLVNGDVTLTHIRVYSGAGPLPFTNRKGRIWNLAGTVLGQATLADALPAGWQLYALDTPLPMVTGTRFIVSFSTNGNYAAVSHAFTAAQVNSSDGLLTARKATDALNGNGVFNAINGPTFFPNVDFNDTFYGIDVGYDAGISGNTPPVITGLSLSTPGDGFSVTATITATDAQTLVGAIYGIDWGDGNTTPAASGSHTYATSGLKAVLGSVTDSGGLSDHAAAAIMLTEPSVAGLNVIAIRDTLLSHALSTGLFNNVSGHEPKAAPVDGLDGALWINTITPARNNSGLRASTLRIEYSFRISTNMIGEPQDDIDPRVMTAAAMLMMLYSGDFELGSNVEMIDLLGAYGEPLQARAGYMEMDHRLYRVMVVTIPLIVSDVFTQTP